MSRQIKQNATQHNAARHMAARHIAGGERPVQLKGTTDMYKPASLRAHLLNNVPGLKPDTLHTFIESGHIEATASTSMSFVYSYTMNVVLTDYSSNADAVIIPTLTWLREHQPELFLSTELMARSFKFEADILSHETYDLGIKLELSERVTVHREGRIVKVQHHGEPPLDPYEDIDSFELYIFGEKVASWTRPLLTD
jgi:hypothetical protein